MAMIIFAWAPAATEMVTENTIIVSQIPFDTYPVLSGLPLQSKP